MTDRKLTMPLFCRRSAIASFVLLILASVNSNSLHAQVPSQGLLREVWEGIGGTDLGSLTNNAAYPNSPTSSGYLTVNFEAPLDVLENYGQRIRGYISPPVSGKYTFW